MFLKLLISSLIQVILFGLRALVLISLNTSSRNVTFSGVAKGDHWRARAPLPNEICGLKTCYELRESETSRLHYNELFTRPNYPPLSIFLRSVHTCDFIGYDCHASVCNKPYTDCFKISALDSFQFLNALVSLKANLHDTIVVYDCSF